jgi:outer membrane protein assembly factor BamB
VKPPAKKSALEGALSVGQTTEAAGEILNEMQRARGTDIVRVDDSRYAVTVRPLESKAGSGWSGELNGPSALYTQETVLVLAANKTIVVLDASCQKLWQATLSYNVIAAPGGPGESHPRYGQVPCVERQGTLYVCDEGVLTAFDLASGAARWRLVSVGIVGLFFDDQGRLYVNTTSANPESLRYSRQINLAERAVSVIYQLDPRDGKVLWKAQPGGLLAGVSGPFLYCLQSYRPDDEDQDNPYSAESGLETLPYMRLKRLDAKTGRARWEHFEQRAPLDIQFERTAILLVFKKEVEVIKHMSW